MKKQEGKTGNLINEKVVRFKVSNLQLGRELIICCFTEGEKLLKPS